MSRKDQLLRILATKRHIVRMKDAFDLARIELDRKAPEPSNALKHVRWGLGVEQKRATPALAPTRL